MLAFFLIVAGGTGAILPFQESLTFLTRPSLSGVAPPRAGVRPFDGVTLAQSIEDQTGGKVVHLAIRPAAHRVAVMTVAARGDHPPLRYDTVWVDPYTGSIRAAFRYGALGDGVQNIVPFLFRLHESLAVGEWGLWIMGVAALIWTVDCFVGFYLTFPPRAKSNTAGVAKWWRRWKPAWKIRRRAGGYKLKFDLHRAGGLWLWPILLMFAVSSVNFNLPGLWRTAMEPLGYSQPPHPPPLARPLDDPPITLVQAQALGAVLMAEEARVRGFVVERPDAIFYEPRAGLYAYTARTSLDPSYDSAQTYMWFSAVDGRKLYFSAPTGPNAADTFTQWLRLLHRGKAFGLPYRIFVSLVGLSVVMLSVTGIAIWVRKRSARILKTAI